MEELDITQIAEHECGPMCHNANSNHCALIRANLRGVVADGGAWTEEAPWLREQIYDMTGLSVDGFTHPTKALSGDSGDGIPYLAWFQR